MGRISTMSNMKKLFIITLVALALSSCSSLSTKNQNSQKVVSATISIANNKCIVDWKVKSAAHCSLTKSETEASDYVVGIKFPDGTFSIPPSCVFQSFGSKKPSLKKQNITTVISLVSTSEVRVEASGLKAEHYQNDPALSFVCVE